MRWTVTTPAASWLNRAPRPAGFSAWAFTRQIVYRDSPRPDASCGRSPRHPIRPHSRPRQLKNPRSAFASAKSFVPALRHVAVLWDSTTGSSQLAAIKAGARGLGVELDVRRSGDPKPRVAGNAEPPAAPPSLRNRPSHAASHSCAPRPARIRTCALYGVRQAAGRTPEDGLLVPMPGPGEPAPAGGRDSGRAPAAPRPGGRSAGSGGAA